MFNQHSKDSFITYATNRIKSMRPDYDICIEKSFSVNIDGRRFDLSSLYRMIKDSNEHDYKCIIDNHLDSILNFSSHELDYLTTEEAISKIMPRIQNISVFEHINKEDIAYVPFVNDTVIVIILDFPEVTLSVSRIQLEQWGIDLHDAEEIAKENIRKLSFGISTQVIESKEGGCSIIISEQDGYDSARLLLPGIHSCLAPSMGGNFYVAIPTRDQFIALSESPSCFRERIKQKIEKDYQELSYPISKSYFYVTQDGIVGEESWDG